MGRGQWQFKVHCFGLCNAPAIFEHLMERLLEGIPSTESFFFRFLTCYCLTKPNIEVAELQQTESQAVIVNSACSSAVCVLVRRHNSQEAELIYWYYYSEIILAVIGVCVCVY